MCHCTQTSYIDPTTNPFGAFWLKRWAIRFNCGHCQSLEPPAPRRLLGCPAAAATKCASPTCCWRPPPGRYILQNRIKVASPKWHTHMPYTTHHLASRTTSDDLAWPSYLRIASPPHAALSDHRICRDCAPGPPLNRITWEHSSSHSCAQEEKM